MGKNKCPKCGSNDIDTNTMKKVGGLVFDIVMAYFNKGSMGYSNACDEEYTCRSCGHKFKPKS